MFRQGRRQPRNHSVTHVHSPYTDAWISLKTIRENLYNYESPIEWEFVRLHLGFLHMLDKHFEYFCDIFDYIETLFMLYECKDFTVLADAYQFLCFVCERSHTKVKMMIDLMLKNQKCCETNGLNFVAKLMKMPFRNDSLPYNLSYDVIQLHIASIEKKFLKHLLEYGVMYIHLTDHKNTWANCHKRLSLLLDDSVKKYLLNLCVIQNKLKRLAPESRQRMLAVFRGVDVILRVPWNMHNKRDLALCFRMAYETIPEPIITSNEIANFLEFVLDEPFANIYIDKVRKDYEKLFPESCEPLSPRSLQHLSRCEIRQSIRQKNILKFALKDLVLPTAIKKYITTVENSYMLEQYNMRENRQDSDFESDYYDSDYY